MKAPNKGLGTGLGALFGESDILNEEDSIMTLPIEDIEPRKDQPRKVFDEEALQSLADSIAEFGLIQPITVRKLDTGYYQIIAGERRWRASRMAGLEEVPVRILDSDDVKTAQLALIENLLREDLNPIEEAEGYRSLIEDYSFTQEQAAKSVGKSRPAIANSLRLLTLSDEVKKMVSDGDISAGHARTLITIEDKKLQAEKAKEIKEKGLSVREAEKLVATEEKPKKTAEKIKKTAREIDYEKEASEQLSKCMGRRVKLSGTEKGKIELEYYSEEDREFLINKLKNIKYTDVI